MQQQTNLEKFYQGWPHFQSMNAGENFIVFKVDAKYLPDTMAKARTRIAELNLPLTVIGTGERSNTFIVKELAVELGLAQLKEVAA